MNVLGARVVRIDRPTRSLVSIELGVSPPNVLLVSTSKGAEGVGLVRRRLRGSPIDSFGLLLRKHLGAGRVVAIESDDRGARLILAVADELVVLDARHDRDARGFAFVDATGAIVSATYRARGDEGPLPPRDPVDESTLFSRGSTILDASTELARAARTSAIADALDRAIARADRKIAAIEADAARADRAPVLRREADLLIAGAVDDRPGRSSLSLLDVFAESPSSIAITLDPRDGPRTAAAKRYESARKLERGAAIARDRAAATSRERDALRAARARLEGADEPTLDELEELLESIGRSAKTATDRPKRGPQPRKPFRAFVSDRGLPLWVGKNAADNDALTIGLAKPHHLFVHVRGQPGSHVIVALDRGKVCDERSLADAATLAAHFSSARGEATVEIVYAERRYVRKPKGSAPGSVRLDREKTFLLRFEPARLARLLGTERGSA